MLLQKRYRGSSPTTPSFLCQWLFSITNILILRSNHPYIIMISEHFKKLKLEHYKRSIFYIIHIYIYIYICNIYIYICNIYTLIYICCLNFVEILYTWPRNECAFWIKSLLHFEWIFFLTVFIFFVFFPF